MKTKLLGNETHYGVNLTSEKTLNPITLSMRHYPFSFQDYITCKQARYLADDLNAMADIVERMEDE